MKAADALSLLIALEERVARIYFRFFRVFREDPAFAQCWWDLARDEYGHAGLLRLVRDSAAPGTDCGEIGGRLWSLVETVERCEELAQDVASLPRALELAIRLESSELDALGHRVLQSVKADVPEGAVGSLAGLGAHRRRLAEAADRTGDRRLRRQVESLLGRTRES